MLKVIIIIVFLSIIFSLGTALYQLIKNKKSTPKTIKALTYRISASVLLFIFITIALMTGIIQPNGIGMQMHLQKQQLQ